MRTLIYTLLSLAFLFAANPSKGIHLLGGDISWTCIKSGPNKGKVVFLVRRYRTCRVNSTGLSTPTITASTGPTIVASYIRQYQTSIPCYNPNLQVDCYSMDAFRMYNALEVYEFESLPVDMGKIPAAGIELTISDCCRPTGVTNTTYIGNYLLKAIMYPSSGNQKGCTDSSPQFAAGPVPVICNNSNMKYAIGASDPEGDQLSYNWSPSLTTGSLPITYVTGFSYNNPLPNPGVPSNAGNIAATIDTTSGIIDFTPLDSGLYVVNVKVNSYRNGQLVASVFHDLPIRIANCPALPPPFPPGTYNKPPTANIVSDLIPYSFFSDTVVVGDSVKFDVQAVDPDFLPGFVAQSITVDPQSDFFGTNYSDPNNGCNKPPCMTIDTTGNGFNVSNQNWKSSGSIQLPVRWKTDCNHLELDEYLQPKPATYNITFRLHDDHCPIPGATYLSARITILPDTSTMHMVDIDSIVKTATSNTINWSTYTGTGFSGYHIFKFDTTTNQFNLESTISNISTTSYVDLNPDPEELYYVSLDSSKCKRNIVYSSIDLSTSRSMYGTVILDWNEALFKSSSSNLQYHIYRKIDNGSFMLIDSTTSLNYRDSSALCNDSLAYEIRALSNGQFLTNSDIEKIQLNDRSDIIPSIFRVNTDQHSNASINWLPIHVDSLFFKAFYIYGSADSLGPFAIIDSVKNRNTLTYYHQRFGNDTNDMFYYVRAKVYSDCAGGFANTKRSNIVKTSMLSVASIGNRILSLNWTPFYNKPNKSTSGMYDVYRRVGGDFWFIIGSRAVGNESFIDTLQKCNVDIQYRIVMDTMDVVYEAHNLINIDKYYFDLVYVDSVGLLGSNGTNRRWFLSGDSLVAFDTNVYQPRSNGTYTYEFRDERNDCRAISYPYDFSFTGIQNSSNSLGVDIYPNPNNGKFSVRIPLKYGERASLEIYGITGKKILEKEFTHSNNSLSHEEEIDLNHVENGIYLIKVNTQAFSTVKRIIIK